MMMRTLAAVLCVLLSLSAWAAKKTPGDPLPGHDHDKWNTEPDDETREFGAFTTSFDTYNDDTGDYFGDIWGIPQWVAYHMKSHDGDPPTEKRPAWFTDNELNNKNFAPTDDTYTYTKAFREARPNWYVRGHLCMKFHAARISSAAEWNTHTLLNAVPQRQDSNGGIWLDLEFETGDWADRYDEVWIIAGPVVDMDVAPPRFGEPAKGEMLIAIPHSLFKIVVKQAPA